MMIGFEVAPVAPSARFLATSSGSIESSQSLVPQAIRERSGEAHKWYTASGWSRLPGCKKAALRGRLTRKSYLLSLCTACV